MGVLDEIKAISAQLGLGFGLSLATGDNCNSDIHPFINCLLDKKRNGLEVPHYKFNLI